jgi:hypothetical protein
MPAGSRQSHFPKVEIWLAAEEMSAHRHARRIISTAKGDTMHRDRLQGEQMPDVRRAVIPWGRLLNDELSPLIGKYGELVGTLLDKYGIANVVANLQVDEFRNFVEQLGRFDDEHVILQKVVRKARVPKSTVESQPALKQDAEITMDEKPGERFRSKAVSLLYRAYEAWKIGASKRLFNARNNHARTQRQTRRLLAMSPMKQVFRDWMRRLTPMGKPSDSSAQGIQMAQSGQSESGHSDAEFIGWQKATGADPIALYNVTAEQHPLFRSTVSEKTLVRENLEVPPTPHREE